jgi:hypothetical protein
MIMAVLPNQLISGSWFDDHANAWVANSRSSGKRDLKQTDNAAAKHAPFS